MSSINLQIQSEIFYLMLFNSFLTYLKTAIKNIYIIM